MSHSTNNNKTNFDNPYQYTRAIRFKLEPQKQSKCFLKKIKQNNQEEINLKDLSNLLLEIYESLHQLIYVDSKKEEKNDQDSKDKSKKYSKKISINKTWLKTWHKEQFYYLIKESNNRQGKYALKDLKPIHYLNQWFQNWGELSKQFKNLSQKPLEDQARKSEIAHIIRSLLNIKNLPYIMDFLKELHTKNTQLDEKVKKLKENLEKAQKDLRNAEKEYLSSSAEGIEIAKASFNYYTVNKKSKEDYSRELEELKKKKKENHFSNIEEGKNNTFLIKLDANHFLNKKLKDIESDQKIKKQAEIFTFKSEQEKEWLKRYCAEYKLGDITKDTCHLSLDRTYDLMKSFKAEQKSIFYEVMAHIASDEKKGSSYTVKNKNLKDYELSYKHLNQESINKTFSLFQFNDNHKNLHYRNRSVEKYNEFVKLTKDIQKEGKAKERGKWLFCSNKNHRFYFTEYGEFCDYYKKIAQDRGKLIAQIKGIEKERDEAVQTEYWSLIYIKAHQKQLWLIPKSKMQDAKKNINRLQDRQSNSLQKDNFCIFESLTMRALHKLCFAEESTFVRDMPEDLQNLQKQAKEIKTDGDKQKVKEKDQKKLEYLKEVLKSDYAKDKLQLENFNLKEVNKAETLQEFEKALEKNCYYVVQKTFANKEDKEDFIKKFDVIVLNLTSYDLEKRNKNTHQNPHIETENKYHTDLWQAFWSNFWNKEINVKKINVGEVRLNPEVKIRYRSIDKDLEKYLKERGFSDQFKHRRKQEQITVNFTLALNAGKRYEELAFTKPEEIREKIDNFNQNFNNEHDFKTAWKYGIDRGQIELATLCLVKFDPDKDMYQVNGKSIAQPTFQQKIKCYTLKDYNHSKPYDDGKERKETDRKAIKNLSYFLDKNKEPNKDIFESHSVSCLDLTTAKVIKGKIFTNGDVMTYLKLKKASAKRQLYEIYAQSKINASVTLEWSEYKDGKEKEHHPEGVLNIKYGEKEIKTIYEYSTKYKDVLSKEQIKTDLNRYLEELFKNKTSHTPEILQINHLRDAITANMVGVICHLQKTYPGFVILEDLDPGKVNRVSDGFQDDENIARRLENALYNKFQALGSVPPHVKDIIQLREDVRDEQQKCAVNINTIEDNIKKVKEELNKLNEKTPQNIIDKYKRELKVLEDQKSQYNKNFVKSSQIGVIVFVDEKNTSQNCPYCEKGQPASEKNKKKKFQEKQFVCQLCGFNTQNLNKEHILKDINDPDKVAAYNIAKKLKTSNEIGKMEPLQSQNTEGKNVHSYQNKNHRTKQKHDNSKKGEAFNKQKHNLQKIHPLQSNQRQANSKQLKHQPFKDLKKMISEENERPHP